MTWRLDNRGLPSLRTEVEALFSDVLGRGRTPAGAAARWLPSLDLVEEPGVYVVEMDMPGVSLQDLSISVAGRRLTLSGRREIVREFRPPGQGALSALPGSGPRKGRPRADGRRGESGFHPPQGGRRAGRGPGAVRSAPRGAQEAARRGARRGPAAHPQEAVQCYLGRVQQNLLANLDDFQEEAHAPALPFPFPLPSPRDRFVPYQVNLLVDNGGAAGAPVVVEDVPTYQNLFGAIERIVDQTGKLVTNFTRIKAGSILRAAGGFLVFNLDDALTEPLVWKPLKRVLKSGRLEVESFNPFGFLSVSGLTPEPVAIDVRLLVTGSRQVYGLLSAYDPDFDEVFKVLADFVPEEPRSETAEHAYALRVAQTVGAEGLRHFTRGAVIEVVRQGARAAGDRDRLSAHLGEVDDLVREASLVAEETGAELVDEAAVHGALARRDFRADWYEQRGREQMGEGTVLIDVAGSAVGQINGLSVLVYGTRAFGRPARLTASVALGSAGIINIEREVKLSGSTHDKGVLIIAGFLRSRFGRDKLLSFSASLCFEQMYGGVDGDSASSAELYALLSAIGGLPLRQDLVVTGSVNQRGEIQAIGGVNEKIEGFFRTCRRLGLSGTQGVIIPAANVRNLVLHPEVIAAVREGQFAVHAVRTIEEGLALLTGLPAGAPGEPGTVLGIVDAALLDMARKLKEFGEKGRRENGKAAPAPDEPANPAPPPTPDPTPDPKLT